MERGLSSQKNNQRDIATDLAYATGRKNKKGNKVSMCSVSVEHDFKEGQRTPTKGREDLCRSS